MCGARPASQDRATSAEGDCYLCVPPNVGIEAAALGASEFVLPGTALAEALHTFTLDSGASRCFFRDSTALTPLSAPIPVRLADPSGVPFLVCSSNVLPCPAVPSGSLSGLHLPLVKSVHTGYKASSGSCDCPGVSVTSSSTPFLVSPLVALNPSITPPPRSPLPATPSWHALPPPCLWSSQVSASPSTLACPALPFLCRGAAARRSSLLLVSPDDCSPADSPHGRDVTFDESVPFYCLFPYRSTPPPPPPLFLAQGPPPVDPLPPQGPAPSGVSQVDPLIGTAPIEVAVGSGAARGVASGGATSGGAEPGGAESEGAGSGGAEPGGEEPGGAEPAGVEPGGDGSKGAESKGAKPRGTASSGGPTGASPQLSPRPEPLSPQQLHEWFAQRTRLRSRAVGAGDSAAGDTVARGAGVTARAGGSGGAAPAGPGGARTRGTGAAGTSGFGGAGAGDPTEPGGAGAGGTGAGGAGAGGARAGGTGARGA
ncbi:unnamed protein product [Closterium sp. NIES-53]